MERNPSGGPKWPTRGDWVAAEWEATSGLPRRSRWGQTAVPSSGEGSAVAGPSPQSRVAAAGARPVGAGWGRRGGRGDYCGATGDAKGPERSPRGTANDDNRQSARPNKKGVGPCAPPAPGPPGGLQWPRAPAAASPAPNPARKCKAARGAAHVPPLPASAQNFEPVHVKLSLPFRGGKSLGKSGVVATAVAVRALFFFSSTFSPPLS